MRPITFRLAMGRQGPTLDETTPDILLALLMALYQRNVEWLKNNKAPSLYTSGVRYEREQDSEEWKDIPNVIIDEVGDCEDLGTWRAAELTVRGIPAVPFVSYQVTRDGKRIYHIRTKRRTLTSDLPPLPEGWARRLGSDKAGVIAALERLKVLERAPDGEWIEDPSRVLGM